VIVPTYNERANVALLVDRLKQALGAVTWEVIFVDDDSPDGTARAVRDLVVSDSRVRCIRRIHRRGLAGACIEGILASSGSVVAVIDGDLQHDERILPEMLRHVRLGADLVIGTRFAAGADVGDGLTASRLTGSRLASALARIALGVHLSDPMSGFFAIRREAFDEIAPDLSVQGFKVLLDIVASNRASARGPLSIVEVPYRFRRRERGESKLNALVVFDYLGLLLAKLSGDRLSIRFVQFVVVGTSGLLIHLIALRFFLDLASLPFDWAQAAAAYTAMTWNFALNNRLTYRDRRLTRWAAVKGLLSFYIVCSVGAVANVGVASWIHRGAAEWWLAGTAGALMGAVFNYSASAAFTWRQR
jgi:dolichol-phosphate mannosyltransferase